MDGKLTRREVLKGAAVLLAAPLAVKLAGGSATAGEEAAHSLGKVSDYKAVGVKAVGDYAVVTGEGGVVHCLSRKCTHKGVLIDFDDKQTKFVCKAHGAMFDKEGTVLQKPAKTDLPRYALEVRGDELYVLPGKTVEKGTIFKVDK